MSNAVYDNVVESGGHWRSDFQIGSRVLNNCYKPILMHVYGIQCDFMHREVAEITQTVIWTYDPQNHCLRGSQNRVVVNFFNWYVLYWVVPCKRARPELLDSVWQRGVRSL